MEFGGEVRLGGHSSNKDDMIHQPSFSDTDTWSTLPEVPRQAEMGYLHLSFEYHKGTLKVRVWQISDLLLPPPQISMIHSIFVRAYFIPDKARKSHRRTEDIIIDMPTSTAVETPKTGVQHIFTASSFKFQTPLLYRAVTEDIVKERSLQLEVCMTQKRSHRTFLMAMVHMPLRTAVRRPIREKYPLIPCVNITIPNNMRVYSAAQLELESSKGKNSPSIRRMTAPADEVPVTTREVELEDVVSLSGEDFLRSHLSLCLDEDSDSDGIERYDDDRLKEVRVINGVGSGGSSSTTLNIPSSEEGDDNGDDPEDIPTVITEKEGYNVRSTPVDIRYVENSMMSNSKKKIIPNELFKVSQDVAVDMPYEDTVLNVDFPSSADSPCKTSSSAVLRSVHADNTNAHTKIMPSGVGNDIISSTVTSVRDGIVKEDTVLQCNNLNSAPSEQKVLNSPVARASGKKKIMVLPEEISISSGEITHMSKSLPHSSPCSSTEFEGLSPSPGHRRRAAQFSPLQDSAFSPASRPETPCWDFYDWSEDLQAEKGLEIASRTLEDSLTKLRQQGIGNLQSVSKEPILPMDLDDYFDSLTVDSEQAERM